MRGKKLLILSIIIAGGIVLGSTEKGWTGNRSMAKWVKVSGVDTILAEKHDRPIVTLHISFPVGSYADPKGKEGLMNLMGDMLLRGTASHSREEIENTLDFLGASLHVASGFHSMSVEGRVLTRNLAPFVDLILEVISEPTFPEDELTKLKDETIAQLHLRLEDDAGLARRTFVKTLYKGHPYSRDPAGTPTSLESISKKDVVEAFKKHFNQADILIAAAGDLKRPLFDDIAKKIVGKLPDGKREYIATDFSGSVEGREVILVDKPDRSQTQFVIGQPGINLRHEDYFKLNVFMTAFAGHLFQAKYMQEIRVKRGWSYGAYGYVDARRDGGSIYLYTFPKVDDTVPAIKLSLELLAESTEGGVTDEAIEFTKKNIVRSFPFQVDTPEKIVGQRIYHRLTGRPDDYLEKYVSKIESVIPAEARAAAKKHLNAKNMKIVVLCTAKDFKAKIGKEIGAKSVDVVPYDQF